MRIPILLYLCLLLISFSTSTAGGIVELSSLPNEPLGKHMMIVEEESAELSKENARSLFENGAFAKVEMDIPCLGIDGVPVWLAISINNSSSESLVRRISIETSWLDTVDVYVLHNKSWEGAYHGGDRFSFDSRQIQHRYFQFDHAFQPGDYTVFIRIETPDPMVLPVYISSPDETYIRDIKHGYTYGAVYGMVLSLIIYNLFLFLSLKIRSYLLYAVYLGSFITMNIAYTGHGYQYFWSESLVWQQWSNPVLMILFGTCGLLFALVFLDTRRWFPKLYNGILYGIVAVAVVLIGFILSGQQGMALYLSFTYIFIYSSLMFILAILSLWKGNTSARYFLIGVFAGTTGASITAMAVWGLIPNGFFSFHAIEIGMMIDATFLSLALSDFFRKNQEQRVLAEKMARIDPLTSLYNRRAFYELADPIWATASRQNRDVAVLIIDIDYFKNINDRYTHLVGDKVLTALSELLEKEKRTGDVLARWGGEEFIVFLAAANQNEASAMAERIRKEVESLQITVDGENISVTISIGIGYNSGASGSIDELIRIADEQLYRAKNSGRNQSCLLHY